MKAAQLDLCMTQGLTFSKEIQFKDSDGVATPMTGWTAKATAKQVDYNHTIDLNAEVTDGANGVVVMSLEDEETVLFNPASFLWDMVLYDDQGQKLGIYVEGNLKISKSTTTP
jgi:hypothetical protein